MKNSILTLCALGVLSSYSVDANVNQAETQIEKAVVKDNDEADIKKFQTLEDFVDYTVGQLGYDKSINGKINRTCINLDIDKTNFTYDNRVCVVEYRNKKGNMFDIFAMRKLNEDDEPKQDVIDIIYLDISGRYVKPSKGSPYRTMKGLSFYFNDDYLTPITTIASDYRLGDKDIKLRELEEHETEIRKNEFKVLYDMPLNDTAMLFPQLLLDEFNEFANSVFKAVDTRNIHKFYK